MSEDRGIVLSVIRDPEFARGWPVLLASFFGLMFGLASINSNTLGVLTPELCKAFGWSRTQVQASFAILTLTFVVTAPIAGALINRFGARLILLISVPALGLTYMSFSLVHGSLLQFYVTQGLDSLVGAGTLPMAFASVVTGWFPKRTGLALATALLGPALFSVFSVPIVMTISDHFGWRGVYLIVGAAPLALYPLIWLFMKPNPEAHVQAATNAADGQRVAEALRNWRLWVMGFAFMLAGASISGCLTNLPTLLMDGGLNKSEVLLVAPVLGACAIAGRMAGGALLDRWWAPAIAFFFLLALSLGFVSIGRSSLTPLTAAGSLALIGLSNGVENDLLAYMVSRYFGMQSYAAVYGTLFMFSGFGGGMSPVFFSWAHDLTGSFRIILYGACGLIFLAGLGLLSLGRYKYFAPSRQLN